MLEQAIRDHGKPAAILTDRGSQFYATESEAKKKGVSKFEERLVELDIRHILTRVRHPQTNGKLERLHGELQRKLHHFENASTSKTRCKVPGNSHVGEGRSAPRRRGIPWSASWNGTTTGGPTCHSTGAAWRPRRRRLQERCRQRESRSRRADR